MSTQNLRQRNVIRHCQTLERIGRQRATERAWAASPHPNPVPPRRPATPSLASRIRAWWHAFGSHS